MSDRTSEMLALYLSGKTLAQVGRRWGVTRQRVEQVIGPLLTDQMRQKRKRDMRFAKDRAEFIALASNAVPCTICGCWCLRPQRGRRESEVRTCSTECADLWVKARYRIDRERRERHKDQNAIATLRNPGAYDDIRVRWATNRLKGTATIRELPPRDSLTSAAVARVKELRQEATR